MVWWVMVLVAVALGGCRATTPQVHKVHLAVLPVATLRGSLAVADDGETFAFAARTNDGQRMITAASAGAPYQELSAAIFSPGARRLFYWAHDAARPGLLLVTADGEVATELARPAALAFSKDGTHWAVSGTTAGGGHEVVVLADGQQRARYADASPVTLSADGVHTAVLARSDVGDVALVVDGTARRHFPALPASAPPLAAPTPTDVPTSTVRYLADGSLLVLAHDGAGWGVWRDETRLATYAASRAFRSSVRVTSEESTVAAIVPESLVLASDAPVAVWWERLAGPDEQWRVVRDGQPVDGIVCARYWESQPPVVSADGRHVAYCCFGKNVLGKDEGVAVVDGRRHGPYRNVWGLRFGEDGEHAAWAAAEDVPFVPWTYYVDGRARRLRFDQVWAPRIGPGGRHLAWQGQRGRRPWLGIDQGAVTAFDNVLWGPRFSGPDTVSWVIRRGRKLTRLDVTLR